MLNKSDEQLMLLIQQGNQRAFGVLTKRYLPKALAFADNIVNEQADDLIQESFIKVWKNAYKFNAEKATFKTWFYTILKNTCYNYLKKQGNIKHSNIEDLENILVDSKQTSEESLLTKETNQELNQAISKLNQREQQAINLRYFKQLSNKETANIMNSSVKAIETLLNRAKSKLRNTLK